MSSVTTIWSQITNILQILNSIYDWKLPHTPSPFFCPSFITIEQTPAQCPSKLWKVHHLLSPGQFTKAGELNIFGLQEDNYESAPNFRLHVWVRTIGVDIEHERKGNTSLLFGRGGDAHPRILFNLSAQLITCNPISPFIRTNIFH